MKAFKLTIPSGHVLEQALNALPPNARNAELVRLASNGYYFQNLVMSGAVIVSSAANPADKTLAIVEESYTNPDPPGDNSSKNEIVDFGSGLDLFQ